jgi:FixJ family two-component response regulator
VLKTTKDAGAKGPPLNVSTCASIWVLDDDASMLKALGRLFESAGLVIEKFNDPRSFLSRLQEADCRVAVLDVFMPEMNGLEVQAWLRQNSPETRIIFISGREEPSIHDLALDAGAFGYLAKPFEDEDLLQLVQAASVI